MEMGVGLQTMTQPEGWINLVGVPFGSVKGSARSEYIQDVVIWPFRLTNVFVFAFCFVIIF